MFFSQIQKYVHKKVISIYWLVTHRKRFIFSIYCLWYSLYASV